MIFKEVTNGFPKQLFLETMKVKTQLPDIFKQNTCKIEFCIRKEICGEKGTLLHCWWECRLVRPLWKTVWNFLRKLKMELPFDPAILLLGIYLRRH